MKRLIGVVLAFGLIGAVGCEQKSGTAPGTNPNKPEKLTLTTKKSQTITQDKTDEMDVAITRKEFSGPVELAVNDLPKGVTLETKDLTIPDGKNTLTLTLKAAADAPPVTDHVFHIVAKAKDIPPVTDEVKLTVKAK
jgi:hypothetical protein